MADDKDKKIGEVSHIENITGKEKIPVSAEGQPGYIEVEQIKGGLPDVQATPKDNEIIYVTNDSEPIVPFVDTYIESNEYYPALGYGVLRLTQATDTLLNYFQNSNFVVKVILPKKITKLSGFCFNGCIALEEVVIDTTNISFASYCFSSCESLRKIGNLREIKTKVEGYTFSHCYVLDITEVNVPKITQLGYIVNSATYQFCRQIKKVTIAAGNTGGIDNSAFKNCTGIETVIIQSDINLGNYAFEGVTPRYIDTVQSTLPVSFPSPDKLEILILRYDGVVPDLADYASTFMLNGEGRKKIEIPVMPVPQSEGEIATLDLPVPMAAYIGTPNTWLKIYVPQNRLKEYQETYPTLIYNLHPITGEDIYALKGEVDKKIEDALSGGGAGGVTWGKIGKKVPETTVIRLNQTISDPYQMLSGEFGKDGDPKTNVISWIRANSHRYVGNYDAEQGMVLRQLDDNNSELYADGSDASEDIKGTNGGDVFMKMPDFWFKGVNVDGNADIVDMHFSAKEPTDDGWTKWDGNTLIGAYEAVAEDANNDEIGVLYSRSGVTPSVSVSQANFKAKARNKSNGDDHFQIVTYDAHQVMALLYMAWYGNTNGQAQCGSGTSSYPKVAGQTNVDGMNDTVDENTRSINFWGLENWWGDLSEWTDNILIDGGVSTVRDYDGNLVRRVIGCSGSNNEISRMILGVLLDMFAKITITNIQLNTYYCDRGYINSSGSVGLRSYNGNNTNGGPFYLTAVTAPSYTAAYYGSRLLYYGRVVISKGSRNASMMKVRSLAPVWRPIDLQYVYSNSQPILRTGFDFNICNVDTLEQVGKLSLYGLNIAYQDIEFESNALSSDNEGNLTFNTDALPISVDMNYKGQLIGTLKFYDISEEELIERQRQVLEQSDNV